MFKMKSSVECDERTVAVSKASESLGFRIALFCLLGDIMYRSIRFGEASWDLFAIIIFSSGIASAYQIKNRIITKSWIKVFIISAIVGASVSFLIATFMLMK